MTLDELKTMTEDEMTQWLIDDAHAAEPQSDAVYSVVWDARDSLSHEFLAAYMAASRRAGEHLQREAEQLGRYSRIKGAGIRGVIDGGDDAA